MTLDFNQPLISVKKELISPGIIVPAQVDFNFNQSYLKQIIHQKSNFKQLKLSPELLGDFRFYSLQLNKAVPNFSLVFITHYAEEHQPIAVIKSVVSYDGKITQQICRSLFKNTLLLDDLVASHYWLIDQICDRLSFEYAKQGNLLAWGLSIVIAILIAPLLFYFVAINWLIKLIIIFVILLLLYLIIKTSFQKYLNSFLLQQFLFGFFARNTKRRKIGWFLLQYFG